MNELTTPITEEQVRRLKVGDQVSISGVIFTGRDTVHKYLHEGGTMPEGVSLQGSIIYHCGPVVMKDENGNWQVTAAGPTTSIREEPYQADIMKKFGDYDAIQFHLKKNDKQYKIYGLSGAFLYGPVAKHYPQSEKECGLKKNIIENEIENFFKNAKKQKNNFIGQKGYDPKVVRQETFYILKDGVVGLQCATWGKEAKKKYYIQDNLRVSILLKEFDEWMINYAY